MAEKKEAQKFKAKELAKKLLIVKSPKGTVLRDRTYLFEAMKTKFGISDETLITEEEFKKKLAQVEKHGGE